MSWSSPVITTTMKAPLINCFQKFCFETQSSSTNILLLSSAATACMASVGDMSSAPITCQIMRMRAVNMQKVWKESVQTRVLMPPLRV